MEHIRRLFLTATSEDGPSHSSSGGGLDVGSTTSLWRSQEVGKRRDDSHTSGDPLGKGERDYALTDFEGTNLPLLTAFREFLARSSGFEQLISSILTRSYLEVPNSKDVGGDIQEQLLGIAGGFERLHRRYGKPVSARFDISWNFPAF